jgi:hypothetical protein
MKQPENTRAFPAFRADKVTERAATRKFAAACDPDLALHCMLAIPEGDDDLPRGLSHDS